MATENKLFISGFTVEYLNGDDSYQVTVYYRNTEGVASGVPDKFSFSTDAKLKKFISQSLLKQEVVSIPEEETEEVVAEAQGNK